MKTVFHLRLRAFLIVVATLLTIVFLFTSPFRQKSEAYIVDAYQEPSIIEEETDPADFAKLAVAHSKQSDKGLELYRDELSREKVLWFYTHVTGSQKIANAILTAAEKENIPVSLAFSLAYVESRYKTKAVNRNKNNTIDRGLFQLNSRSFPKMSEQDFFDPERNAAMGMQHLRFCLDTAGNEVSALAMYNAGTNAVKKGSTPQVTLDYVSKIMTYKSGLESLFAQEVIAKLDNASQQKDGARLQDGTVITDANNGTNATSPSNQLKKNNAKTRFSRVALAK